ncbi:MULTISPECIES: tetratricopeptide repeat protein [unclassified Methylobacterium]|uniref:tetratricopeptide repeat protein n=1 Tax=unclassified Methylobacterium TaxID=2615210 RepID=UPI0005BB783D|nr:MULTISPECIES: tetratricopeptide repeat protein [unclassified Methylobacterium]SFU96539.1 Tetratricopeptide repeat-containing protein [Methylobacterium sp. UNCCL125]
MRGGKEGTGARGGAGELGRNLSWADRAAGATVVALLAVIAGYVWGATPANGSMAAGASVLGGIALAAALLGGLAGFLFGIPRLLTRDGQLASLATRRPADGAGPAATPPNKVPVAGFAPLQGNSNLEEISDWVTKILVGLGLVHAGQVADTAKGAAAYVAEKALSGFPGAELVVLPVGLAAFLLGFLFLYLQARTRITLTLFMTEGIQRAGLPAETVAAANDAGIAADARAVGAAAGARIGTPLGPAASVAADAVVRGYGFDELVSADEFAAWGAAQARARNHEAAETALRRANALAPDDVRILRRLAEVRMLRGDLRGASETLAEARAKAPDDPRVRRQELLLSLYLPPPDGFARARALADSLATDARTDRDPMVHLWRACAYGQAHRWFSERGSGADEMRAARDAALSSVRSVVELVPDPASPVRGLLGTLLDPGIPGDPTADNDLRDFVQDPEFQSAIRASVPEGWRSG